MQRKFKLILSNYLFWIFSSRILKLIFEEGPFSFLTALFFWLGPKSKNLLEAHLTFLNISVVINFSIKQTHSHIHAQIYTRTHNEVYKHMHTFHKNVKVLQKSSFFLMH